MTWQAVGKNERNESQQQTRALALALIPKKIKWDIFFFSLPIQCITMEGVQAKARSWSVAMQGGLCGRGAHGTWLTWAWCEVLRRTLRERRTTTKGFCAARLGPIGTLCCLFVPSVHLGCGGGARILLFALNILIRADLVPAAVLLLLLLTFGVVVLVVLPCMRAVIQGLASYIHSQPPHRIAIQARHCHRHLGGTRGGFVASPCSGSNTPTLAFSAALLCRSLADTVIPSLTNHASEAGHPQRWTSCRPMWSHHRTHQAHQHARHPSPKPSQHARPPRPELNPRSTGQYSRSQAQSGKGEFYLQPSCGAGRKLAVNGSRQEQVGAREFSVKSGDGCSAL